MHVNRFLLVDFDEYKYEAGNVVTPEATKSQGAEEAEGNCGCLYLSRLIENEICNQKLEHSL